MIEFRKENDEVLYPVADVAVALADLEEFKRLALLNPRKRIRLCAHRSPSDRLHEMLIVHTRDCYVRPHRHLDKSESISVLEGRADLILFDTDGRPNKCIALGDMNSGKAFYHRLAEPIYHTLLIRSEFLVFHEVTEGPFRREQTEFPDWAPPDADLTAVAKFMARLETLANQQGNEHG